MRHGKKFNHLGRKSAHRKAMLSNMAVSLIMHKHIKTTLAKAKALRPFVEPLITKSKDGSQHAQRTVFSYLQDKEAVRELFTNIAGRVADRPGGYTRILKLGPRSGDNAEMALIELVDFNEFGANEPATQKKSRRRRGRGKKKATKTETKAVEAEEMEAQIEEATAAVEEVAEAKASAEVIEEAQVVEETAEEVVETKEETPKETPAEEVEEPAEEEKVQEEVKAEKPVEEEKAEEQKEEAADSKDEEDDKKKDA